MQTVMIPASVETLTPQDVAERLVARSALTIRRGEKMGEVRHEDDGIAVDILECDPMDPRVDGCLKDTVTFTKREILKSFPDCKLIEWGLDEDGENDILFCVKHDGDYNPHGEMERHLIDEYHKAAFAQAANYAAVLFCHNDLLPSEIGEEKKQLIFEVVERYAPKDIDAGQLCMAVDEGLRLFSAAIKKFGIVY